MSSIAWIDAEIEYGTGNIEDLGGIKENGASFRSASKQDLIAFLKETKFVCGHNIFRHDLKYIKNEVAAAGIPTENIIDTLFLAPLLFPTKPYHRLLKDDKLQPEDSNNPVLDSIKAKDLFNEEVTAFQKLNEDLREIFFGLLHGHLEFRAFFKYIGYIGRSELNEELISKKFELEICTHAPLGKIIVEHPIELAYSLALIHCKDLYSITPRWVVKNFPEVERIMHILRNKPCITGCGYCDLALDVKRGFKEYFGFDSFRSYAGVPLQERAAKAAVDQKSLLAVFPTGGGKSVTFQVPALMAGKSTKGLTVVISPLQSLMKDQVDNLERAQITSAVTINGLLDPIERSKSFERVEDGSAFLLYISPESLRSNSIERLLLGRKIERFVIDEAHCLSSWGQDFRVDYLYIADFINKIQSVKSLDEKIPVSCFTATAKVQVIEDICKYFKEKSGLELQVFKTNATRENLAYRVFQKDDKEAKYLEVRELIEGHNCPTIIYVSRTRKAKDLADRLQQDGFKARAYHGKMKANEKTENQNLFIQGETQIMVATSAFGMGVDKKDIGMVVHYEISDSLENYVQEAGRAGRDEHISAECYVLFNEEDLDKHFILLNQTKINKYEIDQVWKAVKFITKTRLIVQKSALEIAREAGWDENIREIETRVTTAIAALEDAGYLERGQNMPRIFANSILYRTAQEAIDKIKASTKFGNERQRGNAERIIKSLISKRSRALDEEGEARVDYIADRMSMVKEDVISAINVMREEKILGDMKDLSAYIKRGDSRKQSLAIATEFVKIEIFLFSQVDEDLQVLDLKELNEQAGNEGIEDISIKKIKTILTYWAIKNYIKIKNHSHSKDHFSVQLCYPKSNLLKKITERHGITRAVIENLHQRSIAEEHQGKEEVLVEFSVLELKEALERDGLLGVAVTVDTIEDVLFFLSRIGSVTIEGGFLVIYNRMTIKRLEKNNNIDYKVNDYKKLKEFYDNKVQQIHVVGEYAKKMIIDYKEALLFVDDYFQLEYDSFLRKYFPGSRKNEIRRPITSVKYKQLFGDLSETQASIINDKDSKYMVVLAGPGSGKTKVLVHKLASLILMEEVKQENLLMLTFSRAAASEFRTRLIELIGNAATYLEIKTFHSYCFDLIGKVGTIEKSDTIVQAAIDQIGKDEVEQSRITKTVLVIDEAQDLDAKEFELVSLLMERNPTMRVIAVGDDDQNIFSFRGSDSRYMQQWIDDKGAKVYELSTNYRSKANIVDFTNQFVETINSRLKSQAIVSKYVEAGNIKLIRHESKNLITPVIASILSIEITGSTAILTSTNQEAFQIAGILLSQGVKARLIQSADGFDLINLLEVREFVKMLNLKDGMRTIDIESWEKAKRNFRDKFQDSSKREVCISMIEVFERNYPKTRYVSDLEIFIKESHLEDFINGRQETILVSTMHKAKGREFENVIILLEDFDSSKDDKKRQLYVAMTRAKRNLTIHCNDSFLDFIQADQLEQVTDHNRYDPSDTLILHLTHHDVQLGYFENLQQQVNALYSGEPLIITEASCLNTKRQMVAKFSSSFLQQMETYNAKGFHLREAMVNFIVYWKDKEKEKEVKIVLPEVVLSKSYKNTI